MNEFYIFQPYMQTPCAPAAEERFIRMKEFDAYEGVLCI